MKHTQEQGKDTAAGGESTPELAAAVAAMGALPMPIGPARSAADTARSAITAAIGEVKPARDGLLVALAQAVKDRSEHDHTSQREDWYCLNLSSYLGERMGPVLRRLVDAETERDVLRSRAAEMEALELGAVDGRVSATCPLPDHPTWLRAANDARDCPWCRVAELEATVGDGTTRSVDEDPIAYSLTPEALHAASGAVIEIPPRAEDVPRQFRDLCELLGRPPEVTP